MNQLKQIREAANLTQAALAELSGVSVRTIQQYDCGISDLKNARAHIVLALAKALKVEPERLWK